MNWQTITADDGAIGRRPDLSIAQVCEMTGLSARTVRYYEEVGLLPGVRRRSGGRRVYGDDELDRLRFIQRLKALGLSLGEIKELNAVYAIRGSTRAMLERLSELIEQHVEEIDSRIGQLTTLRDEIARYRRHVRGRVRALKAKESAQTDSPTDRKR